LKLPLSEGCRRHEAVAFDQPVCVVGLSECQQRLSEFFDGFEGPDGIVNLAEVWLAEAVQVA